MVRITHRLSLKRAVTDQRVTERFARPEAPPALNLVLPSTTTGSAIWLQSPACRGIGVRAV